MKTKFSSHNTFCLTFSINGMQGNLRILLFPGIRRFFFILIPFCLLSGFFKLFPEDTSRVNPKIGFYKENVYVQLGGGYSISTGSYHKSAENLNRAIYPIFSDSGNYLDFYYSKTEKNVPYINNGSLRTLRFEYAYTDNIGLGFSIRRTSYDISNFNITNMNESLLYSWLAGNVLAGTEIGAISQVNRYYLLGKERVRVIDALTGNFVFSYHFNPNTKWDRYISLSLGGGKNYAYPVNVYSGFLTLGTRYFIYPAFFIYGELEGGAVQVSRISHNFLGRDMPFGTLYEASFQVGIGASGWDESEILAPSGLKSKSRNLEKLESDLESIEEVVVVKKVEDENFRLLKELILDLKELNLESVELTVRDNKLAVIFLHDLLFSIGSEIVLVKGENELKSVAKIFNKYPTINLLIEGHTDDTPFHKKTTGKYKNNFELSEGRAWEVYHIMRGEKLSVDRMKCIGFGDNRPRLANSNEENKRINRRIEIVTDRELSEFPELIQLLKE